MKDFRTELEAIADRISTEEHTIYTRFDPSNGCIEFYTAAGYVLARVAAYGEKEAVYRVKVALHSLFQEKWKSEFTMFLPDSVEFVDFGGLSRQ